MRRPTAGCVFQLDGGVHSPGLEPQRAQADLGPHGRTVPGQGRPER